MRLTVSLETATATAMVTAMATAMVTRSRACRITSDVPIIAYQLNPVDGSSSYLSDASMLFPITAWDHLNEVVGWVSTNDGTQQGAYDFEKFSVVIVGYDAYDSYAYLGGTGTGVIDPNPQ